MQGYVAAQPLWVTGVQVPGSGAHDLLFVATEHDQVYAFDTNDLTAGPVWQRDFLGDSVLPCPAGAGNCRTLNFLDMAGAPNVLPEAGITATPVIDTTANAIYVVAQTVENGVPFWKLHSLNLGTGAELANSPVEVTGTVNATGPGSVGDQLTFDPVTQLSRTGLALDQGIVYFGASSFDDQEPAHGWVFAYDTATNSLAYYVSTRMKATATCGWAAARPRSTPITRSLSPRVTPTATISIRSCPPPLPPARRFRHSPRQAEQRRLRAARLLSALQSHRPR